MKTTNLLLSAAVLTVALSVVNSQTMPATGPAATQPATMPAEAPDFALTDQDGNTVRLSDYRGKYVVLEWINFECPFVKRHNQAGTMKTLVEKYRPQGVVWLAINTTKHFDVAENKKFHDEWELTYPVLDDHAGAVGRAYGAKTTPDMRIIDPQGRVIYSGAIDADPWGRSQDAVNYVDRALEETLAGKSVSQTKTTPYGCSVKYNDQAQSATMPSTAPAMPAN